MSVPMQKKMFTNIYAFVISEHHRLIDTPVPKHAAPS